MVLWFGIIAALPWGFLHLYVAAFLANLGKAHLLEGTNEFLCRYLRQLRHGAT